ncbi:MAG: PqqD family protein [Candidatus Marinimicrobia bacterium]|nr:PqqD family protein [Candidatus Neomarinimicrobiota bacterium]
MEFYKHSGNVELKQFDDENLLINIETGFYFRLNEVGNFIWPLLDGKQSNEEIIEKIVEEFDVQIEKANSDLFYLAQ